MLTLGKTVSIYFRQKHKCRNRNDTLMCYSKHISSVPYFPLMDLATLFCRHQHVRWSHGLYNNILAYYNHNITLRRHHDQKTWHRFISVSSLRPPRVPPAEWFPLHGHEHGEMMMFTEKTDTSVTISVPLTNLHNSLLRQITRLMTEYATDSRLKSPSNTSQGG